MKTFTGEVHPAAALFPMLPADELEQLARSIREHGLQHPIVVTPDGLLLDGRNRLAACQIAGVAPTFEIYNGDDHVEFVVRVNIERRHLTTGQRAMLALDLLPQFEQQAAKRREAALRQNASVKADPPERGQSRDHAAKLVGTPGRAVGAAKRIDKQAPDLAEKVRSGALALDAAEKQAARRQKEREEQDARVVKLSNVNPDAEGDGWRLMLGDFRERLAELGDGTVDLIVTDPPYPAEFLPLYSDLAKSAARVLKPQGLLLVLTGQIFLPQVVSRLGEFMDYGWTYCQPLPGQNSRIMGRHIAQTWKPWLAYSNGKWPSGLIDWHEDTTDPSKASKFYRWEQGAEPADYLIGCLSSPGAVVLDPFAGTGTYGIAALRQQRMFIGCEADESRFRGAAERLGAR